MAEIETSCADCAGSGRREPPQWISWNQTFAILVARAREARERAGLPPRQWVTGLDNVVGIHGAEVAEPPELVPDEVAAAEQALAEHDAHQPERTYDSNRCSTCGGGGTHLTEDGLRLVKLLERYGFMRMRNSRPTPPPPPEPPSPPCDPTGTEG
ncbi:hypothetical protein ACIBH1_46915 [Nonomuraea sp. NPDC050663]|uniref:hypothetical protein n=1 Tax=Nonomuraea sp. NPDC050663 TaxID=3364370 RepID=UPI00378A8E8E